MIQRNTGNFTGYIIQDKEKVYFHAQDKIFYFISEGVGFFADIVKKDLKSPDYFLYGYTAGGYQLALYTGYEERKISVNYKLRPGIYIVSRANTCRYDMRKFQAIEFIGEILNNLYEQTPIETKYDADHKCYIKIYPKSKKEYRYLFVGFSNFSDHEFEIIQHCVGEIFIITDVGGLQYLQMWGIFAGAILLIVVLLVAC